jgi:hypothetical protein
MMNAAAFTKLNLSWIHGLAGSEVADMIILLSESQTPPGAASKGAREHILTPYDF